MCPFGLWRERERLGTTAVSRPIRDSNVIVLHLPGEVMEIKLARERERSCFFTSFFP